jgi:hypothetical protein
VKIEEVQVQIGAQHNEEVVRLNGSMKQYRVLAVAMLRPVIFAVVAVLLILVVLPAALAAQAGAVP